MAYHPLVDALRRQVGIEEHDDEAAIAAKVKDAVVEIERDLLPVVPYLRALLSVDPGDPEVKAMSPVQRRGETFEALRRLLIGATARRPQIFVVEDLHWIDGTSEQFLTTLVDSVPTVPALLLFTYRPGYASPFGDRSYISRIVPAALSAEDSARMAAAVLATERLPEELRRPARCSWPRHRARVPPPPGGAAGRRAGAHGRISARADRARADPRASAVPRACLHVAELAQ